MLKRLWMFSSQQPEVDSSKISLIGHSEGTTIVPRIAINNPDKVDNIVLMGTLAQNLKEIGYHQIMDPARYAQRGPRSQSYRIDIISRSIKGSCFHISSQKPYSISYTRHYFSKWNRQND